MMNDEKIDLLVHSLADDIQTGIHSCAETCHASIILHLESIDRSFVILNRFGLQPVVAVGDEIVEGDGIPARVLCGLAHT
jgi:hypothetical protein